MNARFFKRSYIVLFLIEDYRKGKHYFSITQSFTRNLTKINSLEYNVVISLDFNVVISLFSIINLPALLADIYIIIAAIGFAIKYEFMLAVIPYITLFLVEFSQFFLSFFNSILCPIADLNRTIVYRVIYTHLAQIVYCSVQTILILLK